MGLQTSFRRGKRIVVNRKAPVGRSFALLMRSNPSIPLRCALRPQRRETFRHISQYQSIPPTCNCRYKCGAAWRNLRRFSIIGCTCRRDEPDARSCFSVHRFVNENACLGEIRFCTAPLSCSKTRKEFFQYHSQLMHVLLYLLKQRLKMKCASR